MTKRSTPHASTDTAMPETAPHATPAASINPEQTARLIVEATKKLDDMDNPDVRAILNWLQDDLMPAVTRTHAELATGLYYVGMHEDRLADLEEEDSHLNPDDAEVFGTYIEESLEILKRFAKEASVKNPQLDKLVAKGEKALELLEEIAGEPDEEEDN